MTRWARYDLRWNPPGYDFLIFLQSALAFGCNAIRFKPGFGGDHGTEEDERRKLEKIAFRICWSYGLRYVVSDEAVGEEIFPHKSINAHSFRHIKKVSKPFPLMPSRAVLDRVNDVLKGKRPIVVVLRESKIQPNRNSGPDWRWWALDHEAVVLEDSEKTDRPPEEIAAYSELASLTIGVWGGAMTPAMFSEHRACLLFKVLLNEGSLQTRKYWNKYGWEVGDQLPWARKQKWVWSDKDDYETIDREYLLHVQGG